MSQVSAGRRIHPHKFAMWLALGSITMMFAGLTSAYLVRQGQGNWRIFDMPIAFYFSTAVILLSSVTMWLSVRKFKQRRMHQYRALILSTLILGILFGILQAYGFWELYTAPQPYINPGAAGGSPSPVRISGNPSESFIFIIFGLHLLHILGGVVALLFVFLRAYRTRVRVYNATALEIVGQYWHFVDILWIYLFVFFLANRP